MEAQNYSNHKRIVIGFHVILTGLALIVFVCSTIYLALCIKDGSNIFVSIIIFIISIISILLTYYSRVFALKAQDRAIRAEENLRHFALTGKLLNAKLTIMQITALRFAPDEEFESLAERAVNENLSKEEIKKAIKNWKGDYCRA
jgi:hypothetical protein